MNILVLSVLAVGVGSAYLYAGDFERYAAYTVGVFERVTHEPAALDGHECREHWCETASGDGEHRRWFKEIVLLGVPVASYGGGSAYYCDDHAHVSIQHGESEESRRVSDSVLWAIVWVAEKFATPVETPERSEFEPIQDDLTTATASAFQLIPVAMMVLLAGVIMSEMRGALDE